jgi:hypothetical protein
MNRGVSPFDEAPSTDDLEQKSIKPEMILNMIEHVNGSPVITHGKKNTQAAVASNEDNIWIKRCKHEK